MDLFETDPSSNTPEFSVSEISTALKRTVEENFSHVRIRGELGRVTRAASGHVYLDLKDDKAVINGNIWRPIAERLDFRPEEGMEVIATGKISTYAPRSGYNLIIERLEIAGEGALMALLEKRKKALASEGLFDAALKMELPFLPDKIGVITSRTGAVIKDILHRLNDRFPREVLLWPVKVQGKGSAEEIAAALAGFNELATDDPLRPDVIIVARGGGSLEDLWSFNEEVVVRAVARSQIPVISAVGHETDTTLIDYVADRRAPTPSAAAEMVVPVRSDLLAAVQNLDTRRLRAIQKTKVQSARRFADLSRALPKLTDLLSLPAQRLDLASAKLGAALQMRASNARASFGAVGHRLSSQTVSNLIARKTQSKNHAAARLPRSAFDKLSRSNERFRTASLLLDALSHKRVLERGFALILDQHGNILKSAETTRTSGSVTIRQKDGDTQANVKE